MLITSKIHAEFKALVKLGFGNFVDDNSDSLGKKKYAWSSKTGQTQLILCEFGFNYSNNIDSWTILYDDMCDIENQPSLLEIHSIVAANDVNRTLTFDIVTTASKIQVAVPYLIYSALLPFLGKIVYRRKMGNVTS